MSGMLCFEWGCYTIVKKKKELQPAIRHYFWGILIVIWSNIIFLKCQSCFKIDVIVEFCGYFITSTILYLHVITKSDKLYWLGTSFCYFDILNRRWDARANLRMQQPYNICRLLLPIRWYTAPTYNRQF